MAAGVTMIKEFIEWLDENSIVMIQETYEMIMKALKTAWLWIVVILTSPVWIIPFIYWWFKVFKKRG